MPAAGPPTSWALHGLTTALPLRCAWARFSELRMGGRRGATSPPTPASCQTAGHITGSLTTPRSGPLLQLQPPSASLAAHRRSTTALQAPRQISTSPLMLVGACLPACPPARSHMHAVARPPVDVRPPARRRLVPRHGMARLCLGKSVCLESRLPSAHAATFHLQERHGCAAWGHAFPPRCALVGRLARKIARHAAQHTSGFSSNTPRHLRGSPGVVGDDQHLVLTAPLFSGLSVATPPFTCSLAVTCSPDCRLPKRATACMLLTSTLCIVLLQVASEYPPAPQAPPCRREALQCFQCLTSCPHVLPKRRCSILKSTDGGTSWTAISNAVTGTSADLRALCVVGQQVWAMGASNSVTNQTVGIYSSNGSTSWQNLTMPSVQAYGMEVRSMSCTDAPALTAVTRYVSNNPSVPSVAYSFVYTTTDGGCWGEGVGWGG